MTKFMNTISLKCFLIVALANYSANAEVSLQFSTDGGLSFENQIEVPNGSQVDISVFLTDDAGSSILQDEGLLGFGLLTSLSTVDNGSIQSTLINPGFDIQVEDLNASGFEWTAFVLNNSKPSGSVINLGEFQFAGTNLGSTVVSFNDPLPGSGTPFADTLSGAGTILDEFIFGAQATETVELTIDVVEGIPEPQSGILLLSMLMVSQCRRVKKPRISA